MKLRLILIVLLLSMTSLSGCSAYYAASADDSRQLERTGWEER